MAPRGRPSGQKNRRSYKAGRPKKQQTVPRGQTLLSFNSASTPNDIPDIADSEAGYVSDTDDDDMSFGSDIAMDEEFLQGVDALEDRIGLGGVLSSEQNEQVVSDEEDEEKDEGSINPEEADNSPGTAGVLTDYFEQIHERLKKLKKGERPAEYMRGTFWIEPMLPFFALEKKLDPRQLYLPRMFLWMPHLLTPEKLKFPFCSHDLGIKGFNTDPQARRIIDIDWYAYDYRSQCVLYMRILNCC
jgi:hypothetical protein